MKQAEADLDLRSLTRALRRYGARIVAVALIAGALGFFLSGRAEKRYAATAYVEIEDPAQDVIAIGSRNDFDTEVQRRAVMVLFESPAVRRGVAERMGAEDGSDVDISADSEPDSALVAVTATSDSAERAQETANLAVEVAAEVRRERLASEFEAIAEQLERDSDALDVQIRDLEGRIESLDQAAAQAGVTAVVAPGAVPTAAQTEAALIAKQQADEAAVVRQQRAIVFEQKLELDRQAKQYQLEAAVRSPGFRPYRDAGLPSAPVNTPPRQVAMFAAAAGLVLATGIAYVVAYGDGRLRRGDQREADRVGLPLLATLRLPGGRSGTGPLSEDYKGDRLVPRARESLALMLRYRLCGDGPVLIGVAAPRADGRCPDLLTDVGLTLARSGMEVLVIDADLRRAEGGLPGGLSGVLAGDRVLESELKRIPTVGWGGKGSLSLLPAGNPGTDPLGLAGSGSLDDLMLDSLDSFDCVLVDLPPVLEGAESLTMSRTMGAVVLTATAGRTKRADIGKAVEALETVGARVEGLVVSEPAGRRRGRKRTRAHASETVAAPAAAPAVPEEKGRAGSRPAAERLRPPQPVIDLDAANFDSMFRATRQAPTRGSGAAPGDRSEGRSGVTAPKRRS